MDKLFLTILNMSLTGSFVIAAIYVARLPLKKAPKIISYCLWAIAGFRLVFPFSIETVFSLIPFKAQTIPTDIGTQPVPRIDSGILFVNNAVSSILPAAAPAASVNPLQIWTTIGAFIWFVVAAAMIIYGMVSFVILKRKTRKAAQIEANIYEAKYINSPFVLGVFNPGIYLPTGLSGKEKSYVILHEQTHIRRRDHIIKFVAYFILCLHWFNPLVWAAFLLMGADMEMSCDERVLKEMGDEMKKDYSLSLLSLATEYRIISGSPLAFGEGGIKERIKNVLNFKKTSRVIIVAAVAFVAVLSVGFAVNRIVNAPLIEMEIIYEENPAFFLNDMKLIWDDTIYYVTSMDDIGWGKEIGYATDKYSTWYIYELNGYNRDYLLAAESEDVWRVMSIYPPEKPLQQYILENATEKQRAERMLSVTLYGDGTARLAAPPISSYMLPNCTYTFADGELLIYSSIETEELENAFGVKNGEVIASFTVTDDNTLIFRTAAVPLFADEGARYVSASNIYSYEPRKWLDYYFDEQMPWGGNLELELPEYPGTVFQWSPYEVKAVDADGEKTLFGGMPVWNVYLADLTGDGLPELCATVSLGSGIIDERIIVFDYATGNTYDLSDRMYYDYALYLDNGRLMVKQTKYPDPQSDALATGELAIVGGELTAIGIDRTRPETD
jgi:beta-lactamase regulating signal transducer with metallopeptidase domain